MSHDEIRWQGLVSATLTRTGFSLGALGFLKCFHTDWFDCYFCAFQPWGTTLNNISGYALVRIYLR